MNKSSADDVDNGTKGWQLKHQNIIPVFSENIKMKFITTTEDKIRNSYNKHLRTFWSKWMWVTPLSLSVTLLTSILSTQQRRAFLGVPPEVWDAFFLFLLAFAIIVFIIFFLYASIQWIWKWEEVGIDAFVKSIESS